MNPYIEILERAIAGHQPFQAADLLEAAIGITTAAATAVAVEVGKVHPAYLPTWTSDTRQAMCDLLDQRITAPTEGD